MTRVPYELVVADRVHVDEIAERLGPSDRARLDGTRDPERERFLVGRSAILVAVSRLVGEPVDALTVDAVCTECGGHHGAPVVFGARTTVHVSLAHGSGRAFAVAAYHPIGVDAEPRSTPAPRLTAIRDVTGGRGPDPLGRWTAIEAILKADGRGLRVDPRQVLVGHRRGRVADRGIRYRLRRHRDLDGHAVAVAWSGQEGGAGGNAGSAASRSQAWSNASSGASANPAANRRKSSVDAAP
jgi:4'-phosphopantetheinyl transferase